MIGQDQRFSVCVSFSGQITLYLFKINVISEFYLLGVNLEDLHSSKSVRNADVDFSIESSKSSERRVNRVRSIRCAHYNDVRALFESVHQRQQLRDDSSFDFAVCFVSFGRD